MAGTSLLVVTASGSMLSQVHWTATNGPPGGSVRSLLVAGDGALLAATLGDGFFRSTDGGNDWIAMNDGLEDQELLALAEDGSGRLYAGTSSGRIYRSTAAGLFWEELSPTGLPDIHAIAAPASGGIFAGGSGGLRRSMDGGATWDQLELGFPQLVIIQAIVALPENVLLMGTFGMGGGRSTDNGDTWLPMAAGPPDNIISSYVTGEDGELFACTGIGIFRSTDAGISWTELPDPPVADVVAMIRHDVDTYLAVTTDGVFLTTDSGSSWVDAGDGLPDMTITSLAADAAGVVFVGTDGDGVYRNDALVAVSLPVGSPDGFRLGNNYPNPFNAVSNFEFMIPEMSDVSLVIHDLLGRTVATLVHERLTAGRYRCRWDGRSDSGAGEVASGVYFYRLAAGSLVSTKKLVLTR